MQRAEEPEATITLATSLYDLLQELGKPRLLERVGKARDAAAAKLDDASGCSTAGSIRACWA